MIRALVTALSLASLGALQGCASTPTSLAKAVPVLNERQYIKTDGVSTIVVVRDVGFYGSGVNNHLFLNGEKIASLAPGEQMRLYVNSGTHTLGVKPTDITGSSAMRSIETNLEPRAVKYFRISSDINSGTSLNPAPELAN